jgi:thiamine-monophosphate kinase
VGDVGEDGLLQLLQPFLGGTGPDLPVGAGDDAAVWTPPKGRAVVVTTDSLIEDVHFHFWDDRDFMVDLGWKLLAISVSDLAAMGATAGPCFIALGLPATWPVDLVRALYEGLAACASSTGAVLAGGNISASLSAALTSTCVGSVDPDRIMRRAGVQPGWRLGVTGSIGGAAAALKVFHNPDDPAVRRVEELTRDSWVRRLRHPEARLREAEAMVDAGVRVAIDVSDGLFLDATRLLLNAPASGLRIDGASVPVADGISQAWPDWEHVVGGGEDYELLFAGPDEVVEAACRAVRACGTPASVIGEFDEEKGVRIVIDDQARPVPATGHQHFA